MPTDPDSSTLAGDLQRAIDNPSKVDMERLAHDLLRQVSPEAVLRDCTPAGFRFTVRCILLRVTFTSDRHAVVLQRRHLEAIEWKVVACGRGRKNRLAGLIAAIQGVLASKVTPFD